MSTRSFSDHFLIRNRSASFTSTRSAGGSDTAIALPDYLDWRQGQQFVSSISRSARLESRNLSGIPGREPERIAVAFVTANFFDVIGLPPQLGRTFREDEDKPGAPALVVLSDRLWDRALSSRSGYRRAGGEFSRLNRSP